MTFIDPIGDMITRIRNGQLRLLDNVKIPSSKLRVKILDVLKKEGYISNYKVNDEGKNIQSLSVYLKYNNGSPVIKEINRVSKPGRRIYAKASSIPKIQKTFATLRIYLTTIPFSSSLIHLSVDS